MNKVIHKVDVENSLTREFRSTPRVALALSIIMLGSVIFKVFNMSIYGVTYQGLAFFLLLIATFLPLIFIWVPAAKYKSPKAVPLYDWVLATLSFSIPFYLFLHAVDIQNLGWGSGIAPFGLQIMCFIFIILVLEATRRVAGKLMFLICLFFAAYPLFAGQMPGILAGISFPFWRTVSLHVMGGDSLLGMVMQVVGNVVIGYLIFGVFFQATGGGKFFLDLALCLLGKYRGGAAKVSILASSLFGSISGSPVSNVITTGVVTIPAMEKTGYPAYYAAAIEACASTGGSIMPPVMGSAAFFCAQFLGIPYYQVALAAAIPSFLYYTGLFLQVDCFAVKTGKKGLKKEDIPSLRKTLKEGWFYLFAMVIMVYFIFMRQEVKAPFYTIAVLLVMSMINKRTRLTLSSLKTVILDSGKSVAKICALLLGVEFIIGSLSITGVAHAFTYNISALAGDNLALLLIFGAIASFILGMGMVPSVCYIFLALTLVPSLIRVGVYPLAAHLFVLYWGIISCITPPVALAAMAAAGISGAPSMKVGFQSMRLGIVIYFIPFAFVLNPALVGYGSIWEIVTSIILIIVGIIFLSGSLEGELLIMGHVRPLWRFILAIAGLLFFCPVWQLVAIGTALGMASCIYTKLGNNTAIMVKEPEKN